MPCLSFNWCHQKKMPWEKPKFLKNNTAHPMASWIFWSSPGGTCVETETGHAFGMDGGAILSARRHQAFGYTKHTLWQLLIPQKMGKEFFTKWETFGHLFGGGSTLWKCCTPPCTYKKKLGGFFRSTGFFKFYTRNTHKNQ